MTPDPRRRPDAAGRARPAPLPARPRRASARTWRSAGSAPRSPRSSRPCRPAAGCSRSAAGTACSAPTPLCSTRRATSSAWTSTPTRSPPRRWRPVRSSDLEIREAPDGAVPDGPWDVVVFVDVLYLLPADEQRRLLAEAVRPWLPADASWSRRWVPGRRGRCAGTPSRRRVGQGPAHHGGLVVRLRRPRHDGGLADAARAGRRAATGWTPAACTRTTCSSRVARTRPPDPSGDGDVEPRCAALHEQHLVERDVPHLGRVRRLVHAHDDDADLGDVGGVDVERLEVRRVREVDRTRTGPLRRPSSRPPAAAGPASPGRGWSPAGPC